MPLLVAGKWVNCLAPTVDHITPEHMGTTLSRINRWCGGTRWPISVAQHSLFVADLMPPPLRFAGLLHDVPEMFTNDIPHPIKKEIPQLQMLDSLLWLKFVALYPCLPHSLPDVIKNADELCKHLEVRLCAGNHGAALDPSRLNELTLQFPRWAESRYNPFVAGHIPDDLAQRFVETFASALVEATQ